MTRAESFNGIWWSVGPTTGVPKRIRSASRSHERLLLELSRLAARKEHSPISDADLAEFANDRIPMGTQLVRVEYDSFSGFTAFFEECELMWRQWWLRT